VADVQPFCGLHYNLGQIGDLSSVICPPYDVISAEEQRRYHDRSPYNVIRLEFGLEWPNDSSENNKYTRAAMTLDGWLRHSILIREKRPAFYLVEHHFRHQNTIRSRFSLMARVRLEDLSTGHIRPHEMTMRGPAIDRLRLLQACRANLSPIMGIFRHKGEEIRSLYGEVAKNSPGLSATDDRGVTFNVWAITEESKLARLSDFFTDKTIYIADGHHRYETALAYHRHVRSTRSPYTGREAFNFVMMALTDSADPNLIVFPTHRLVRGLKRERIAKLEQELSAYFHVAQLLPPLATAVETLESWLCVLSEKGEHRRTFGLYGLHARHLCLVEAREEQALGAMPEDWPDPVKHLDVSILHWLVLRRILGIDSREREESCLQYTRDGLEALSGVDSGAWQLAFLLNPAPVSSVLAVSDARARMPQKSTYFYPKTPTGLVINPLWEE